MKRVLYIMFLIGLTIFMYPHVQRILFDAQNKTAFDKYENVIEHIDDKEIRDYISDFEDYNEYIASITSESEYDDPFIEEVPESETEETKNETIEETIEVVKKVSTENGAFGYLDIPKINQNLPIYLGASNSNLAKGVAQIEYTSLPIGGVGTNAVIAGHRGFTKGYTIFKHLDKLEIGDRFYIHVYNMTLTYEVFQIEVILPSQTEKLAIDPEKDMVTLLTCTPYQVSNYRLLVYGIRVNGIQKIKGSIENKGVLSVSTLRENTESIEVRNSRFLSYAIVSIGTVMWIVVMILLLRTFRKEPKV